MNKSLFVVLICISIVFCITYPKVSYKRPQGTPENYRFIETSVNNATWRDPIEAEIAECGKGNHGGYMDITDYPLIGKIRIPTPSPLPSPCRYDSTLMNVFLKEINMTNWNTTVQNLVNFGTRYYTNQKGLEAAQQIQRWTAEICGSRCSSVLFPNTFLQPSVIVTFQGEGPTASEHVIVGAHLDSTASPSTSNAPGADDDASGVAVLIETINVLIQSDFKPKRTLVFQFYAAEEVGLRGSQAIVDQYVRDNINVYAMIQFDMVGYSRTNPIFIGDYVNAALTKCLAELAAQFPHHPTWGSSNCGYGCSDHASWTKAGYRASFPFETTFSSSNPYIHTANDLLARLNETHARLFVELALAGVQTLTTF